MDANILLTSYLPKAWRIVFFFSGGYWTYSVSCEGSKSHKIFIFTIVTLTLNFDERVIWTHKWMDDWKKAREMKWTVRFIQDLG